MDHDTDKPHPVERLTRLIETLRGDNGCPWDKEQTFDDVLPSIIEEAYELQWANARRSQEEVLEELGDVFFLVCFAVAILHEEDRSVTVEQIASRAYEKIKRRHPHVFGDKKAASTEESLVHWNRMKEKEREERAPDESALADIPDHLSPIRRAETLQRHAAKVGFDWPDATGIIEKLREELGEIDRCLGEGPREHIAAEIGDLFFSIVNLSRFLDISSERTLETANAKFLDRFRKMEKMIHRDGKTLEATTLEEMDAYWDKVKNAE